MDPSELQLDGVFYAGLQAQLDLNGKGFSAAELHGTLTGRFPEAELRRGGEKLDGKEESLLLLGASLTYAISDNVWAELAYNYDELDSDVPYRSFERNYLSVGIGTTY